MPSGSHSKPPKWTWSISRSHLLRDCARAFEFQSRTRHTSPATSITVRLSTLTGIAIHEGISSQVDRWALGGGATERGAVLRAFEFLDGVWGQRQNRVVEVMNGLEVDPGQIVLYRHIVRSRLERFFQMLWPQFSPLRHQSHEKLAEVSSCALPVAIKIDLACWDDNEHLIIADWKTGNWQNLLGGRVQLAVYVLWAREKLRLPLAAILPALVSLQTGEVERFHPTEYDLGFVMDQVMADRDRVEEYVEAGGFPASPRPERCWGCVFLSKCDPGREVVGL